MDLRTGSAHGPQPKSQKIWLIVWIYDRNPSTNKNHTTTSNLQEQHPAIGLQAYDGPSPGHCGGWPFTGRGAVPAAKARWHRLGPGAAKEPNPSRYRTRQTRNSGRCCPRARALLRWESWLGHPHPKPSNRSPGSCSRGSARCRRKRGDSDSWVLAAVVWLARGFYRFLHKKKIGNPKHWFHTNRVLSIILTTRPFYNQNTSRMYETETNQTKYIQGTFLENKWESIRIAYSQGCIMSLFGEASNHTKEHNDFKKY